MKRYGPGFKESLVRKMMPSANVPIMRLAEETRVTLAKWGHEARNSGRGCSGER